MDSWRGSSARRSACECVCHNAIQLSLPPPTVVLDAPPEVKAVVDSWGEVPGLDLMRRVKDEFDPTRVLAPGRYVGGL